jgi:TatD-related deoxyribonuclease
VELPGDLPVVDHHCHLAQAGDGVAAVQRFRHAGGTHIFLATQQYGPTPPTKLADYQAQFERTEAIARRAAEAGVIVYVVVAPYPVDLVSVAPTLGLGAAVRLQEEALDLAGRWVEEQRAVALGEVGRPHFAVPPAIGQACEGVFGHALEVARDVGCPAVVHSEDLDSAGYRGLANLAARVGFPVGRLVKHYARSHVPPAERGGVVPSFLASRSLAAECLEDPGPWFWETDYLDDPKRPGAVLDLATVPRRAAQAAARGPEALERLRIPFESSIRAVYGFTPVVGPKGGGA